MANVKLSAHQIQEFGETHEYALIKAVQRLVAEVGPTKGTQAVLWYGIDDATQRPVARLTVMILREEK